ncbi:hypothetical protein [Kitasatospora griseola]|uniref:hypothetical protein n=1 Tax=Kitasatospora griseola TaxID=2064 RepID=UPI000AB056C4|nr:hypothetical protein [Kitasatospora griseola]
MAYVKDAKGYLYKKTGPCGCGKLGEFHSAVKVPGKGPFGSNKPLPVYVCADCK